jgi:hypothetical protein
MVIRKLQILLSPWCLTCNKSPNLVLSSHLCATDIQLPSFLHPLWEVTLPLFFSFFVILTSAAQIIFLKL